MKQRPAHFKEEKKLWSAGISNLAGVDEVGRGSWAGPVVAAAVVFPKNISFPEQLFDSKLILPRHRERLAKLIYQLAVSVGLGVVGVPIINRVGIGRATQKAFRRALSLLSVSPERILIDAFYIKHLSRKNQIPIKKGDQISSSIAAASIVAKVHRDSLMRKLGRVYPEYRFGVHKGYGTLAHQEAIRKYNFCKLHRKSFNLYYLTQ